MNNMLRSILLFALLIVSLGASLAQEADSLQEIRRQIQILAEEIEKLKLGEVAATPEEQVRGLGPAAMKIYKSSESGVSLAGYGEVVYENYARTSDAGTPSGKKDMIDYLRNVLYVGYRYNDWILFNSEIELEHSSTGKGGEVSIEFGYVELMYSRSFNLRAGMVLVPVGIVNEQHEPTTFFGTLRPQVEQAIIPTTWRGIGIGGYGEVTPWLGYRVYVVEGLSAAGFSDANGVRGGRQKGAKAIAEDLGLSGKIELTPAAGLLVAGSFYGGNSGQGMTDSLGGIDARTIVLSAHAQYAWNGLEIRGLVARTTVDDAGRVSTVVGKTVGSVMTGWYISGGYDVLRHVIPTTSQALIPYVQYEKYDTHSEVPGGFIRDQSNARSILTLGLLYKPHPHVGFKVDYRDNQNDTGTGVNQWNLALNYLF